MTLGQKMGHSWHLILYLIGFEPCSSEVQDPLHPLQCHNQCDQIDEILLEQKRNKSFKILFNVIEMSYL